MTLRGVATINFFADDLLVAQEWYSELLGIEPYFTRSIEGSPAYIEFRIGDYQQELGLVSRQYSPSKTADVPGGAVLFWHVDDVEAALEKLIRMGAAVYQPLTQWGEGFVTASVVDPFGNLLGIMYNKRYLETLK